MRHATEPGVPARPATCSLTARVLRATAALVGLGALAGPTFAQIDCTIYPSPPGASFGSEGGPGEFSFSGSETCFLLGSWANSDSSWLQVTEKTSKPSGQYDVSVTVEYKVYANPSANPRTGHIIASPASIPFPVTQSGAACTYALSPAAASYSYAAGSGSFDVTAPTGCSWSAVSGDSWVHPGGGGNGDGTVGYGVEANNTGLGRVGHILVGDQTFTVYQMYPRDCTSLIALSPTGASYSPLGGNGAFAVSAPAGCAWAAVSDASWVQVTHVATGRSGTGSGTVDYHVDVNDTGQGRTGHILVEGETFTVVQSYPRGCTFSLLPTGDAFGPGGGYGSVSVTTASDCGWVAASDSAWLTVYFGGSGAGNGTVFYQVAANDTGFTRTGHITVQGQIHTVTQGGVTCSLGLSPAGSSLGYAGDSGTVTITAPNGCGWGPYSNSAWIHVTSAGSGSGNGTFTYSVDANGLTTIRTGHIAVAAGTSFTVTQAGIACSFSLSSPTASASAAGGGGTVDVTAPQGCHWNAVSDTAWLSITGGGKGDGNGTVSYAVTANGTATSRTGHIQVQDQRFTLSQAGINLPRGALRRHLHGTVVH
jgi:hypothetical protein